jgi:hypothetical protein
MDPRRSRTGRSDLERYAPSTIFFGYVTQSTPLRAEPKLVVEKRVLLDSRRVRKTGLVKHIRDDAGLVAAPYTIEKTRAAALARLVKVSPKQAAQVVVRALEDGQLTQEWFDHLIAASESLAFNAPELRARLALALEARLGERRDRDGPAEWAAVRRLAVLLTTAELHRLVPWVTRDAPSRTRQAALQSLAIALGRASAEPAVPSALSTALEETLDQALGETAAPQRDAMLFASLEAYAAAGGSGLAKRVVAAVDGRDAIFRRQLVRHLTELAEHVVHSPSSSKDALLEAVEALRLPL